MKYHEALKTWNAHKKSVNPAHGWFVPRKGTPEHAEVVMIQQGTAPDRAVGNKPDLKISVPKPKPDAHPDVAHEAKAVAEVKHENKKKLGAVGTGEMKLTHSADVDAVFEDTDKFLAIMKYMRSQNMKTTEENVKKQIRTLMSSGGLEDVIAQGQEMIASDKSKKMKLSTPTGFVTVKKRVEEIEKKTPPKNPFDTPPSSPKPVVKPVEKAVEKPVEKPVEKAVEKPVKDKSIHETQVAMNKFRTYFRKNYGLIQTGEPRYYPETNKISAYFVIRNDAQKQEVIDFMRGLQNPVPIQLKISIGEQGGKLTHEKIIIPAK